MKKQKRVKVKTAYGERYIVFRPVPDDLPITELICDSACPYSKICSKLPNPVDPDNPDSCFADFCGSVGDSKETSDTVDPELGEMVPVEGTLEEAFKDHPEIFKTLIDSNPMVSLKSVIDNVCSGWCEMYDPSYCNCNENNGLCILHSLFIKKPKH